MARIQRYDSGLKKISMLSSCPDSSVRRALSLYPKDRGFDSLSLVMVFPFDFTLMPET